MVGASLGSVGTAGDVSTGKQSRSAQARRLAILAVLAAATGGCGFILPDRIHYEWQPEAVAPCAACDPGAGGDRMVGLALSGGGSRAAVFAGAVLEALADRGLSEQITHISSVSGGGFAASYYVTHPLAAACPPGSADAASCRRDYFATLDAAMREDFLVATVFNQLANPGRITSPTRRASSLQEALDDSFLGGVAFGDLPPSPVLLVNAASYDDARRFVFSNLVLDDARPTYAPLSEDVLRASSFSLADCAQPTPADMPLSLAVVASAAFPPVFGPVTVQAQRSCSDAAPQYWHLGDGGIIDNTGSDTLYELVARRVHGGAGLGSALILIADAGAPMDPEDSHNTADLSLFSNNPGAVVDVAQARGNDYAQLFWQREGEAMGIPFDTILFRFNEAELTAWPASCADEQDEGRSIAAHLSTIPTALDISDCDAELMVAAARDVVRRRLDSATEVLQRHGLAATIGALSSAQ